MHDSLLFYAFMLIAMALTPHQAASLIDFLPSTMLLVLARTRLDRFDWPQFHEILASGMLLAIFVLDYTMRIRILRGG